jgi:hypothetical protein
LKMQEITRCVCKSENSSCTMEEEDFWESDRLWA